MNHIPQIRNDNGIPTLYVKGEPFFVLGGEIHNSSASSLEYMERHVWSNLEGLNMNSLIVPLYWETIEPEEGRYQFGLLDGLIGQLSSEEFMELLPEFRLAFSYFTPRETDQIGEYVAGFYGKGRKDLFALEEVAPAVGEYGRKLDRYVRKMAELG